MIMVLELGAKDGVDEVVDSQGPEWHDWNPSNYKCEGSRMLAPH